MLRAAASLLLLPVVALSAQQTAHPLVGTWKVSVPAGFAVKNGESTPILSQGTLTVTAKGDSLLAHLEMQPRPEAPAGAGPKPVDMSTKAGSGDVIFISTSMAQFFSAAGGTEASAAGQRKLTSTWKFAVKNDSLSGSVDRQIEGFEQANKGAQPVTGIRQKAG